MTDWTQSPSYTKLRIRRIIVRARNATEQSLRDRLAKLLMENRGLYRRLARENAEILRLAQENDKYAEIRREFDEQVKRVNATLNERRNKPL